MARPKITRLSDPSNPYGGKKTPTRDRTPAEKMAAAARSRSTPERKSPPKPAAKAEKPDSHYMRLRKLAIDNEVERNINGTKGKKK